MSSRTRAAAVQFLAAVEYHLQAVEQSTGETDAGVRDAFNQLSEAFIAYEDALYDEHDEVLPFEVLELDDEDEVGDDEDDDDDDDEADEAVVVAAADDADADDEDDDIDWIDDEDASPAPAEPSRT